MLTLPFNKAAQADLQATAEWRQKGLGYFVEQSTMPQTIGYSLADSPVGLLAWIYEKLVAWSDNYTWTDDEGELGAEFMQEDWRADLVNLYDTLESP